MTDQKNDSATIQTTELLQTSEAWNGTPYTAYPAGKPQLTVMKMTIPPHTSLPWHSHPMPNMAYCFLVS